jgi:hypothetical protein
MLQSMLARPSTLEVLQAMLAHPSTLEVLQAMERAQLLVLLLFSPLDSQLSLSKSLGVRHIGRHVTIVVKCHIYGLWFGGVGL